jgi:hypothetical protein
MQADEKADWLIHQACRCRLMLVERGSLKSTPPRPLHALLQSADAEPFIRRRSAMTRNVEGTTGRGNETLQRCECGAGREVVRGSRASADCARGARLESPMWCSVQALRRAGVRSVPGWPWHAQVTCPPKAPANRCFPEKAQPESRIRLTKSWASPPRQSLSTKVIFMRTRYSVIFPFFATTS